MRFSLPASLVFASFALAPLALMSSPAHAQRASGDYRCTALADQVRSAVAAAPADGDGTARARRALANGQLLCNAGNAADGGRQYRAALRSLGVEEVRAAAPQTTAQR